MGALDTDAVSCLPEIVAILEGARRIGESSRRAGTALGLDPDKLARIERYLDAAPVPDPPRRVPPRI